MSIPTPHHPPREFQCTHCKCVIKVPWDLPATTGPCPSCQAIITSPAFIPPAPAPGISASLTPLRAAPPVLPTSQPVPSAPEQAAPVQGAPVQPQTTKPDTEEGALHTTSNIAASEDDEAPKRSKKIPALILLVLLAVIATVVFFVASRELTKAPPSVGQSASSSPSEIAPGMTDEDFIRTGWQKEAFEVLENYMAATSSAGKLPFILNGPALASRLEEFYGGGTILDSDTPANAFSVNELTPEDYKRGLFMLIYDQPSEFDIKEFFRPLASLEVQYGVDEADLLLSMVARAGNFAIEPLRVQAFFKRTPEGLKLDWEIFVQTKYRTFRNFVEFPKLGPGAIFRVVAMEDVPETGRAAAGTRSYRLLDPANIIDNVRINVPIDSDVGRALSVLNWLNTESAVRSSRTATLELKWTGDEDLPVLEISRFICWEFVGLGGEEVAASPATQ